MPLSADRTPIVTAEYATRSENSLDRAFDSDSLLK